MRKKDFTLLTVLMGLSLMLILNSGESKDAAQKGFALATNTVLPSLLPLLIIFMLIIKSGAENSVIFLLGKITSKLFRLPKGAAGAIFFGLIGGYPMGALLTKELQNDNIIDDETAKRIMYFNFCGGAGFIITAVGSITLNSTKIGYILFFSCVLSSVIIGITTGLTKEKSNDNEDIYTPYQDFGDALFDSVSKSVNSVLNITAYIILFCCIDGIVNIPSVLEPIIEITNGICRENSFSIPLNAAFLSFGGLCIHFQIFPILKSFNMSYFKFLLFRLISAALSFVISYCYLLIFPMESPVFSNNSSPVFDVSVINIPMSILLVFGSFVFIFDVFKNNFKSKSSKS